MSETLMLVEPVGGAGPDDDEVAQGIHRNVGRAPGGGRRGVHRELRADLQPLGVVKLADDVGLVVDVAGPDDHVIAAGAGGDGRIDLQSAAGRVDGRVGLRKARRGGACPWVADVLNVICCVKSSPLY